MDQKQVTQMFKAALAGDLAKVRDLLANAVSIEVMDNEKMTPIMRAAQGGHFEVFQEFVKAGANLNVIAMSQTDLLETAAEGGNLKIVQFLVEKGMPIEGHWQPRSKFAEREGHITPLISAAINGHLDVVRYLVEVGADVNAKFDKQDAQKHAKSMADLAKLDSNKEDYARLMAVVKYLGDVKKSGAAPAALSGVSFQKEIDTFATKAAAEPATKFREELAKRSGGKVAWKPVQDHGVKCAGVWQFSITDCKGQEELDRLQKKGSEANCLLILTEPWTEDEPATLALFPTTDKLAVVTAVGTEGANDGVETAAIIRFLQELDAANPFELTHCNHEMVGGRFQKSLSKPLKVAEMMTEICPGCMEHGFDTPEEFAAALKTNKTFLLRWA